MSSRETDLLAELVTDALASGALSGYELAQALELRHGLRLGGRQARGRGKSEQEAGQHQLESNGHKGLPSANLRGLGPTEQGPRSQTQAGDQRALADTSPNAHV
jgi:hypothetical protein